MRKNNHWPYIFILLPCSLFIGWMLVSNVADYYVLHFVQSKTGYYKSDQYSDYILYYLSFSLGIIPIPYYLLTRKKPFKHWWWIYWVMIFTCIALVVSYTEITAGRPFIPEVIFLVFIAAFHISLTKQLLWMERRWKTKQY